MNTYERIIIDDDTELDWEGPGYYRLRECSSLFSAGAWYRWYKVAELDAEQPDNATLVQTQSDLT